MVEIISFMPPETVPVDRIIRDLADGMPNHRIAEYFGHKRFILEKSDALTVFLRDGLVQGVIALTARDFRGPANLFFIETLLIAESAQSQSVSFELISACFHELSESAGRFPDFVAMKTYNPVTYSMMKSLSGERSAVPPIFPLIPGGNSPVDPETVAEIAALVSPGTPFDLASGVFKGGAGEIPKEFWSRPPRSKHREVNEYFDLHVGDWDRLFCVVDACRSESKDAIRRNLRIPMGKAKA